MQFYYLRQERMFSPLPIHLSVSSITRKVFKQFLLDFVQDGGVLY